MSQENVEIVREAMRRQNLGAGADRWAQFMDPELETFPVPESYPAAPSPGRDAGLGISTSGSGGGAGGEQAFETGVSRPPN